MELHKKYVLRLQTRSVKKGITILIQRYCECETMNTSSPSYSVEGLTSVERTWHTSLPFSPKSHTEGHNRRFLKLEDTYLHKFAHCREVDRTCKCCPAQPLGWWCVSQLKTNSDSADDWFTSRHITSENDKHCLESLQAVCFQISVNFILFWGFLAAILGFWYSWGLIISSDIKMK